MSAGMIMELKPKIKIPDCPPSSARDQLFSNSRLEYSSPSGHKDTCSGQWRKQTNMHRVSYSQGRYSSLLTIL